MDPVITLFSSASFDSEGFSQGIQRLGLSEKLAAAATVGIKPNLCAGSIFTSESGVVVNSAVVRQTCEYIRQINSRCRLLVIESDSTGNGFAYKKFEKQGYEELFRGMGVELVDATRSKLHMHRLEHSLYFKNGVWLASIFDELDFFVSLGKMKTHNMTTISCCLKNIFGCLPASDKSLYHPFLSKVIVDVNRVLRPDLWVCEGVPVLQGNGPVMGTPVDLDVVAMSNDPVACDAWVAEFLGFDPMEIGHLTLAHEHGVGSMDPASLVVDKSRYTGASLHRIQFVSREQQLITQGGLIIQGLGGAIERFGHVLHQQKSLVQIARGALRRLARRFGGASAKNQTT